MRSTPAHFGGTKPAHWVISRPDRSYTYSFQAQGTRWFLIFSGAVLGVSAALLWSAQGAVMMSYPLEKDKGKAFAIFWAIFSFGAFIGAVIALAINIRSGTLGAVSTSTYIVRRRPYTPLSEI
jgi:MFS family permease